MCLPLYVVWSVFIGMFSLPKPEDSPVAIHVVEFILDIGHLELGIAAICVGITNLKGLYKAND